jgi:alpha-1,2-mannosyltransferase
VATGRLDGTETGISHAIGEEPTQRRLSREKVLAVVVIFTVAFVARLSPTLRGSGLFGINFYDDGVHYAAATGLMHGQLPYRDFLLLHPPGIVLALAPFAGLAYLVGDARGFALARLAFMALGGVNALLVSRFLRPVGTYAAWLGGLFYALFWPAIYSEHTVLLEGLANTCLLVALLLIVPVARDARPSTAKLLIAGAALGFAMTIKIWGIVPILVLFGWLVVRFDFRRALLFLAGAAALTTAVCLPFFVAAPATMWRMVVLDQIQRNDSGLMFWERVNEIAGLTLYRPPQALNLAVVLASLGLLAATIAAWSYRRTRTAVLLILSLGILMMTTPSWFVHYAALTAAVFAIAVGAGGQRLVDLPAIRRSTVARVVVGTLVMAALVVPSLPIAQAKIGDRFPGRTLGNAVASRPGCVTSDHPSPLILMNVMSRNLDRGCPLVVDLGGASYHLESPDRGVSSRRKNEVFQVYALDYLRTGDTMIIARFRRNFGLSSSSWKTVQSWPAVAKSGRYTLRAPQ